MAMTPEQHRQLLRALGIPDEHLHDVMADVWCNEVAQQLWPIVEKVTADLQVFVEEHTGT